MPFYEHRLTPVISRQRFVQRMFRHIAVAIALISIAWAIGIIGYHFTEHFSWLDATINAAMILGGMGPVDHVNTTAGKLFASFYALFSGIFFIAIAGIVLAPITHRLLHTLHVDERE
jgi:hypothetical protein